MVIEIYKDRRRKRNNKGIDGQVSKSGQCFRNEYIFFADGKTFHNFGILICEKQISIIGNNEEPDQEQIDGKRHKHKNIQIVSLKPVH
jgi:hypothetical protein